MRIHLALPWASDPPLLPPVCKVLVGWGFRSWFFLRSEFPSDVPCFGRFVELLRRVPWLPRLCHSYAWCVPWLYQVSAIAVPGSYLRYARCVPYLCQVRAISIPGTLASTCVLCVQCVFVCDKVLLRNFIVCFLPSVHSFIWLVLHCPPFCAVVRLPTSAEESTYNMAFDIYENVLYMVLSEGRG